MANIQVKTADTPSVDMGRGRRDANRNRGDSRRWAVAKERLPAASKLAAPREAGRDVAQRAGMASRPRDGGWGRERRSRV